MAEYLDERDMGEGVRILRLDRPPVSALSLDLLLDVERRLGELALESDLRALVLTGAGGTLSAGLDLKEAAELSREGQTAVCRALNGAFGALYGFPKPVVAAINGHAIAGGFFFVLGADYRIAGENGSFGLTEVRAGLRFPLAPLEMAKAEMSAAMSRRLLLSGRNIKADEALDHGLVDEVVAHDEVVSRAVEVARDYATVPPIAYADVKDQLRGEVMAKIRGAAESGADPTLDGWFTEESRAAIADLLAAATGKRSAGTE